jgi:signal transduction histidine kinase
MFLIALTALFSFQNIAAGYAAKNFSLGFEILSKDIQDDEISSDFGAISSKNIIFAKLRQEISKRIKNSGACRVYFIDRENTVIDSGFCRDDCLANMPELAAMSLKNRAVTGRFVTSGFNIPFFSDSKRFFVMSGPVESESGANYGSVSAAWDFDTFYSGFKRIEKLLFTYIIVNTFVLCAVGVYQIGNITAKPLKKIIKKTESVYPYHLPEMYRNESDFEKLSLSISRIIEDLTVHRKQLQDTVHELELTNRNLKKMQKDIIRAEKFASAGRLSAALAHEIGNPIGIISGYLELVKSPDSTDLERIEYAERAENELGRIDRIIRQLLDYARPTEINCSHVSVHSVINELVSAFSGSGAIGKKTVQVELLAQQDTVFINHEHLRQVFMNLFINASDAINSSASESENKGRILIRTVNHENNDGNEVIRISFIDNGPGIPDHDIENIFEPFYTTKPAGKGTGLGLAVCQMIVDEAGGRISALNIEGGAEISVSFPLVMQKTVLTYFTVVLSLSFSVSFFCK